MICLFNLSSKMICVCAYEARTIRVMVIVETRGFYKEKRCFIYSLDNVEILWKKLIRIDQIISQYY